METESGKTRGFTSYEYKEIVTESSKASLLLDGYESFGWKQDENVLGAEQHSSGYQKKSVLRLKRDRKIMNKMELTRLQRNFEACVSEIDAMEKKKTSVPAVYALSLGIVGTAFMAGATFAVTAAPPLIILCIILAVPGFLGWILPYFLYRFMCRKQTEKLNPLIEKKYDEIYEICEKGSRLSAGKQ